MEFGNNIAFFNSQKYEKKSEHIKSIYFKTTIGIFGENLY